MNHFIRQEMNAYPDTENTMITPPPAPQKQWLVAYVKSCMEKKTAERLTAMGIEHYLPVQTVERRWSDRVKRMEKLVLPLCTRHAQGTSASPYSVSGQPLHGPAWPAYTGRHPRPANGTLPLHARL